MAKRKKRVTRKRRKKEIVEEEIIDIGEIINFFKKNKKIVSYVLLAAVVVLGTYSRTLDIPNLNRTILALDGWVFYRYATYIAEKGYLPINDTMRYYPIGFDTRKETTLNSYFIALLYKLFSPFIPNSQIIDFAIIYPVVCVFLMLIVFYFLVREIFKNEWIALLATLFLSSTPGFLFRTSAGVADKEALAILLMFTTFFFFIKAIKENERQKRIIFATLSGIFSGLSALSWGGAAFMIISISLAMLFNVFLLKIKNEEIETSLIWGAFTLIFSMFLTTRHGGFNIIRVMAYQPLFLLILAILFYKLIYPYLKNFKPKKIPEQFYFGGILIGIGIVIGIAVMPNEILSLGGRLLEFIMYPGGTCRWCISVSENQPPYFYDPYRGIDFWSGFRWTFFLFFFGSALLFYEIFKKFPKKETIALTTAFLLFITFFIFSRPSSLPEHAAISEFFGSNYLYSLFIFIGIFFIYFILTCKLKEWMKLKSEYIILLTWFLIAIIMARGAIRNIFSLVPPASIISAFFIDKIGRLIDNYTKSKNTYKIISYLSGFLISLLLMFQVVMPTARSYYPSYSLDWKNAENWVKENTDANDVFIHWWDYGYWVQSGFNRTTILDGGNYNVTWDEEFARNLFCAYNQSEYFNVLNRWRRPKYFLIVDDDVLKFVQIAGIGGRDTYFSPYIFVGNIKNDIINPENFSDLYVLASKVGIATLGKDVVINGKLFSSDETYIIYILIPANNETIGYPYARIYNSVLREEMILPYNCICKEKVGCEVVRNDGIPACAYFMQGGVLNIPEKAKDMLFTRLYLLNEDIPDFKLVYENDVPLNIVSIMNGGRTNIRIYEINYENASPMKEELSVSLG